MCCFLVWQVLVRLSADLNLVEWGPIEYRGFEATSATASTDGKYIAVTGHGGPGHGAPPNAKIDGVKFSIYDAYLMKVRQESHARTGAWRPQVDAREPSAVAGGRSRRQRDVEAQLLRRRHARADVQ